MGNIYIDNRGTGNSATAGGCLTAILSFVVPGLGQLLLGRLAKAICHFVAAVVLWPVLLGWIVHIWSAVDASR